MDSKRFWVTRIVLLLLVLTLVGFFGRGQAAAEQNVLKLGTIMPMSGPLGIIGITWNHGYDIFADWINEQGGVKVGKDNYKIRFVHEDSKASPEASAAAANKLVYEDKVNFVMGAIMTPASQAIYGVTKPAGVLHVLTYTQDPYRQDIWGPGPDNPLLVLTFPTTNLAYKSFFQYLAKNYPNVKRLVHCEVPYPVPRIIEEAKNQAQAAGLEVVGLERHDYAWTDYYPFATAVLTHRPDAVSVEHAGPDQMALMIKALREQGFKGPIMSLGSSPANSVVAAAGARNSYDLMFNQGDTADPNAPQAMKNVKKLWEAKYPGEPYVDDTLMAWDGAWVLVQVISKAGSLDAQKVLSTFEGMKEPGSVQTVFGPGYIGGQKTYGVNRYLVRPIPVTVVERGGVIKMASWSTPEVP
jgi:branched-chain amino acid transport system substrate-binding protein